MNPINNSFTSIEQVTGQYLKTQDNKTKKKTTGLSFEDVLRQQMGGTAESTSELKFSKHANMRLEQRDIALSADQSQRLEAGVAKASEKGIKESLVIVDSLAFIVNVPNQTVVTAMDQTESDENVFTNIDGACNYLAGPYGRLMPLTDRYGKTAIRRSFIMMRALYSGVSGLKTHQTKMDVIGNNISNVNTVGFKASSTTFADIMYQTTSGATAATATTGGKNAMQIGLGVSTAATKVSITSPGAAQSTGDALDIRLTNGSSTNFFIVNNGTENLFTRAGSFYLDGAGNLAMTSTGYTVMGWQVDPLTGDIRKDTVSALRIMQADNMTKLT